MFEPDINIVIHQIWCQFMYLGHYKHFFHGYLLFLVLDVKTSLLYVCTDIHHNKKKTVYILNSTHQTLNFYDKIKHGKTSRFKLNWSITSSTMNFNSAQRSIPPNKELIILSPLLYRQKKRRNPLVSCI